MDFSFILLFLVLLPTFGIGGLEEEEVTPFVIPETCFPKRIDCPAYYKHWRYNPKTKACTQHYYCLEDRDHYMPTQAKCLKACTPPEKKKEEPTT